MLFSGLLQYRNSKQLVPENMRAVLNWSHAKEVPAILGILAVTKILDTLGVTKLLGILAVPVVQDILDVPVKLGILTVLHIVILLNCKHLLVRKRKVTFQLGLM